MEGGLSGQPTECRYCRYLAHNILISKCDKGNVIKELLNVKFNFATVSVLDVADIVLVLRLYVLSSHF